MDEQNVAPETDEVDLSGVPAGQLLREFLKRRGTLETNYTVVFSMLPDGGLAFTLANAHPECDPIDGWNPMVMAQTLNEAANTILTVHEKQKKVGPRKIERPRIVRANGDILGRNSPCLCGSGKKYKACCMP